MGNLRQAAQWALQYLESNADADSDWEIITALRAALAEPDGPCPTCVSLARTVMMDQAGQA
jgi:hypothetical protein